jgi:hypothetical protein
MLDPTTVIGKLRLRCGDYNDLPILPDTVYQETYTESGNSLNQASVTCAQYILAILSQSCHQRLVNIEIYGSEAFNNYLTYLTKVVLNPNLSQTCPIPYSASNDKVHPLIQFQEDWENNFVNGTQSEQLAQDSITS